MRFFMSHGRRGTRLALFTSNQKWAGKGLAQGHTDQEGGAAWLQSPPATVPLSRLSGKLAVALMSALPASKHAGWPPAFAKSNLIILFKATASPHGF